MSAEEFEKFCADATKVQTRPKLGFAKRIKKVRCLNPKEKITYIYERTYEMTFDDGSKMVRGEDHWRRFGVQMTPGNYVIMERPDFTEAYLTPIEMNEQFVEIV